MSKTPPPAISTQLSISSKTNTPLTTPAGTPGKKSRESGASKLIKAPAVAASKSVKKTDAAPDPNSAVALAASKGRKKLPGGGEDDGKTGSRKNAGTKKAPKQEKKKKKGKRQPKMHPILMYLGYGPDVVLRDRRALEVAQGLDLRQWHLRFLKANFDKVDIDGAGTLDASELFESVGEVRTPLTDKLFEVLDMHPNSIVEFDDYVRVVCTYCMFTKDEILRFCFRCFDHDDSGTIDEKEFCELCK
jgi:Ca2+-binding EF-hand superfamily protein